MMFNSFVIVSIALALIGVIAEDPENCYGPDYELDIEEELVVEVQCLLAGGLCIRSKDCPRKKWVPGYGLCPLSRELGKRCCYSSKLLAQLIDRFN